MPILSWPESLAEASTESQVVDVARDYLATLSHEEFARLPESLRPPKLVDAADITAYAFELVREECRDEEAQGIVQRLAHIMSRASIRLSEIMVAGDPFIPSPGSSPQPRLQAH
jgi:hypothetical protein